MREMTVHDVRNGRSRRGETTVHDAAKRAFTIARNMQSKLAPSSAGLGLHGLAASSDPPPSVDPVAPRLQDGSQRHRRATDGER
jgi:hypothetical protein